MYVFKGIDPLFWLKLLIVIVILLLLLVVFNTVMRRWLKVEKRSLFLINHVNSQHKKIDWTIRITVLVIMVIGVIINLRYSNSDDRIDFLEPYFLLFMMIIFSEIARAIMEWKYAPNRRDYIFTIIQLLFITILLIITLSALHFGWIDM